MADTDYGVLSASCSCELDSDGQCICTVTGKARVRYSGCYSIMRCWWVGEVMYWDELYNIDLESGSSAYFNYNGSFDNSNPTADYYFLALVWLKDDETIETLSQEEIITPEECKKLVTDCILSVRAKDADTDTYMSAVWVYIDSEYVGLTLGSTQKLFTLETGYSTITLAKDGYVSKVINTHSLAAGETFTVDTTMEIDVKEGTVNVTTVDCWTDAVITGAKVYVGGVYQQKTTPCTLSLESSGIFGYEFLATKEYFLDPSRIRVVEAGKTIDLEIRMQAVGMQCDISLDSIEVPDTFPPPFLPTGLPSLVFALKMPYTPGTFTYYGIGWVASVVHPAAADVAKAFVDSLVVTVNGAVISPTYVTGTEAISFDIFGILESMDFSSVSEVRIQISHATRIWFDTFDYGNTSILESATESITIPFAAPGLCSFLPVMSGPAGIPLTLPTLPTLPPTIGDSVLDIDLGAACEDLVSPSAVPIKIFLFGSDTPAIDMSVSPTSYAPDLSTHILSAIAAMIVAGTEIPTSMSVLLNCPEDYSADGFSSTMTDTELTIPLTEPGLCTFTPTMSGPAGILLTPPTLPTLPPTISDSVLAIDLGAACEGLTAPAAVPIKIFLFGSDTPAIDMSVSPTSYAPDLSTHILSAIAAMIVAGTTVPTSMPVLLTCPEDYSVDGFSSTMTPTELTIPLTKPGSVFCGVSLSLIQPAGIVASLSELGVPGLNLTTLPITGTMGIACTEDGAAITRPAGVGFPDIDLYVMGEFVDTIDMAAPGDFAYDIFSLIDVAKLIDQNITEISVKILYPTAVWIEGTTTVDDVDLVEKTLSIPVTLPGSPGDIFCDIVADLTVPDKIPLEVTGMLPSGTTDLLVDLDLSAACDDGAPTDPFSGLYAIAFVNDTSLGYIYPDSDGKCSLDLATAWHVILSTINAGDSTIELEIEYPKKVNYTTPGVTEWGTKTETIDLDIPDTPDPSPGDIFCDIVADLTAPDTILLEATGMLPPGTTDLMVDLDLSAACDDGAPTDPFSELYATAFVNDTSLGYMYLDSAGKCSLDLATAWHTILPTITAGDSTIELEIKYPKQVKYSTPTVQNWGTKTKTIDLDMPDGPECVLTAADYFTCPDGTVIQLNKCVNGVKVPTGATCPGAPPDPSDPSDPSGPGCLLTAADFFTCPDGTVIQLNKCVNGFKVSTGETCQGAPPEPPEPPGPTCTEGAVKDLFVCPDGTRLYLKKCENGIWVDTGESCPETPECTESEYFTCPDGTTIELYSCVEGKRVATEAKCPVVEIDTKMVYVVAPLLARVGKKTKIVGISYCGVTKVGGEKAWITINGQLLTTTTTRAGELKANWTPVVPGLYTICVTVPESSACNAAASSCTMMQVVEELSVEEIKAAEEEFENAKEWIGQIMERI